MFYSCSECSTTVDLYVFDRKYLTSYLHLDNFHENLVKLLEWEVLEEVSDCEIEGVGDSVLSVLSSVCDIEKYVKTLQNYMN